MSCTGITIESLKVFKVCPTQYFDLNLEFKKCSPMSNNDIEGIGFESTMGSNSIKRLSITWPESKDLTRHNIQSQLPRFLRNQSNLQSLKFNVHFKSATFVNNASINMIGEEILKTYINVPELAVSLKCNFTSSLNDKKNLTDKGIEDFAVNLTKLTKLKKLSLKLEWLCLASNKGLNFLADRLCQDLQSLEYLSLSFKGWTKISGKGTNKFVEDICKNMTNLKYLSIEFRDCVGLFSSDTQAIADKVSKFMSQKQG